MVRWPAPVYRIQVDLSAPLSFVYRWCTDYRSDDGRRAGEVYDRRILSRSPRRVVYEDLWWRPDGWRWRRYAVTLRPPDRWHADSIGNVRDACIDYRLVPRGPDRTRLYLRLRRRPGPRAPHQPSRRSGERDLRGLWRNLSRALAADYRNHAKRRAPTIPPGPPRSRANGRRLGPSPGAKK